MSTAAVSIRHLSAGYGDIAVLDDFDFDLKHGEFVAVIGRSGEGKTTLLNAIAGLVPYKGLIKVAGRLAYVFQNNALFPWMTIQQNITFGIADRPAPEQERALKSVMERLGMVGLEYRYPFEISGGQAQRVAVGRALAVNPDTLLMDEPFAALDYFTRNEMQNWLAEICSHDQQGVLFVTHNIEEGLFLADRVVLVKDRKTYEFEVKFPKPRAAGIRYSPEFLTLAREILGLMGQS